MYNTIIIYNNNSKDPRIYNITDGIHKFKIIKLVDQNLFGLARFVFS